MYVCVLVSFRSTWLNILEPVHLAGVLDTKYIDLIKCSSMVTEMQHNIPNIADVVRSWPYDDHPQNWDSCYQKLLEDVTDGVTEASKVEVADFAQVYELCAVQGHFVQTAVAGGFLFALNVK